MSDPLPYPDGFPPTARVIVDLDALAANYRSLQRLAQPSRCAAVVKADAYGLGVAPVTARLQAAGCDTFFVATAGEALELRQLTGAAEIAVFEGVPQGAEPLYREQRIVPVINTPEELKRWVGAGQGARVPAILHIDTGMTRLGLDAEQVRWLAQQADLLARLDLRYTMTHLACADELEHPLNEQQIEHFQQLRSLLPAAPTSIGNSAGVLRGAATRGDLTRLGIALYGGQVLASPAFIPTPVVRWQGRILQVRRISHATSVGYGATQRVRPPAILATIGVGYADGYLRSLGEQGMVGIGARRAPLIGRVSMDLITVDVSDFHPNDVGVGTWVDLIGGCVPLDDVAAAAGTISYELLTRMSRRDQRIYRGDVRGAELERGASNVG